MFTGIVEGTGLVTGKKGGIIFINPLFEIEELKIGESFSIDGVCLTLLEERLPLEFEISEKTREKTSLGRKKKGDVVNIERALLLSRRLSGHLLLGHVDGVGRIAFLGKRGKDMVLEVFYPSELSEFIVPGGSIGVDGISLTVQHVRREEHLFGCVILPYTYERTSLPFKRKKDEVNIEVDIIARYVKGIAMEEKRRKKEEKILRFLEGDL